MAQSTHSWFLPRRAVRLTATDARGLPSSLVTRPHPPLILFDGDCGMCSYWVEFVLRHDRDGHYRFAPLQSPLGTTLMEAVGGFSDPIDSIRLFDDGYIYERSTAILKTLAGLRPGWRASALLLLIPAPIRDYLYDLVARRRYAWFGRSASCRLPTVEERARFV